MTETPSAQAIADEVPASSARELPAKSANDREHLVVNVAVRGQHVTSARGEGLPFQAGHPAARFGHDQGPAGDIPGFQVALPEAIHPPGGHPAQIDSRGSEPADGSGAPDERTEQADDLVDA